MPTTSGRNYPVPAPSVSPDVPTDIGNLATAVDTDVTNLLAKPNFINFATASINSAYAGNTLNFWQYWVWNQFLIIRGRLVRNSGLTTVGEGVCQLPSGAFPTDTSLYRIPFQSNETVGGHLAISITGAVTVAQVSGSTSQIIVAPTLIPLN